MPKNETTQSIQSLIEKLKIEENEKSKILNKDKYLHNFISNKPILLHSNEQTEIEFYEYFKRLLNENVKKLEELNNKNYQLTLEILKQIRNNKNEDNLDNLKNEICCDFLNEEKLEKFEQWISVNSPRYTNPHDESVQRKKVEEFERFCDFVNLNNIDINFDEYGMVSHIEEYLEEIGESQSWLARKSGISRTTIHSIVNSTKSTSLENAFKISKVLNVPVEKLFEYVKNTEINETQEDE